MAGVSFVQLFKTFSFRTIRCHNKVLHKLFVPFHHETEGQALDPKTWQQELYHFVCFPRRDSIYISVSLSWLFGQHLCHSTATLLFWHIIQKTNKKYYTTNQLHTPNKLMSQISHLKSRSLVAVTIPAS